jgi:hypothetical protein
MPEEDTCEPRGRVSYHHDRALEARPRGGFIEPFGLVAD